MAAVTEIVTFNDPQDLLEEEPSGEISIEISGDDDLVFFQPIPFDVFISPEALVYTTHSSDGVLSDKGFLSNEASEEITMALDSKASIKNTIADGSVSVTGLPILPAFSAAKKEVVFVGPILGKIEIKYPYMSNRHTITVAKPAGYDDEKDPGHEVIVVAYVNEQTKASAVLSVKNVAPAEDEDDVAAEDVAEENISIEVDPNFEDAITPGLPIPLLVKSSIPKYTVTPAYGTVSKTGPGSVRPVEVVLSFLMSKEASLPDTPASGLEWEWTSLSSGEHPTPLFADKKVTLPIDHIGDLTCRYNIVGDIWTLNTVPPEVPEGEEDTFEGYSVKVAAKVSETVADCVVDYAWDDEISVEIDPAWLDGKDSEPIRPDEKVPLLVRSSGPGYRIETMYGVLTETGSGTSSPEDTLIFSLAKKTSISVSPDEGSLSALWDGIYNEEPPLPELVGKDLVLEKETVGRLKVEYSTTGGAWELDAPWPTGHPEETMDIEVAVALRNARGNCTVTFDSSTDDADVDEGEINIFLEEDLNDGKSSFFAGDLPILVVAVSLRDVSYTVKPSMGTVKKKDVGFELTREDSVPFSETTSGELTDLPLEIISWEWVGTIEQEPLFALKVVTVPTPAIGTLKVTYKVLVDLWELTPPPVEIGAEEYEEEFDIIVVAKQGEQKAECTVPFGPEGEEEEVIGDPDWPYKIEVVDNEDMSIPVPGAIVYFQGKIHEANDEGLIFTGLIPRGDHDIRTTAEGFIDSDEDRLRNDKVKIGD